MYLHVPFVILVRIQNDALDFTIGSNLLFDRNTVPMILGECVNHVADVQHSLLITRQRKNLKGIVKLGDNMDLCKGMYAHQTSLEYYLCVQERY